MQHGGNVQSTYYKFLQSLHAVTAAATVAPCTMALVDVIGFTGKHLYNPSAEATTNTLGQSDTFSADTGTDIMTS